MFNRMSVSRSLDWWYSIVVCLARIVMPFSRSRSIESMTRSTSSSLARNTPLWRSIASTSVVLPWSTWATMARLRRSARTALPEPGTWADGDTGAEVVMGRSDCRTRGPSTLRHLPDAHALLDARERWHDLRGIRVVACGG